jgi:hypothetical protein
MSLTGKPQLTANAPLSNDGFWPDLIVGEFLSKYRIPSEYAEDVIVTGMTLSMVRVNEKLAGIKAAMQALNYASLQDYCEQHINRVGGQDVLQLQYQHAVFSRSKAFLLQQFNSMNRRPVAENAAKEAPETEQFWLDQSQSAIASFFALFLPQEQVSANDGVHVALL